VHPRPRATRSAATPWPASRRAGGWMQRSHAHMQTARTAIRWCLPATKSDLLDRDRIGRIAAPLLACTGWPRARRPHQGLRLNAGHIALSELGDAPAQLGIVAIAGVQQHHIAGKAALTRPADLLQRDLRL